MATAAQKTTPRKSPATTGPVKTATIAPPPPVAVALPSAPDTAKTKKAKLVRDSFTIPKAEYAVIEELKQRAVKLAQPSKKSELIRAGIKALAAMSDASFTKALKSVPAIKTGRPKA